MALVSSQDMESLFQQFCGTAYKATEQGSLIEAIQEKCEILFSKDYKYQVLDNTNGELAATYPSKIILLEGEKTNDVLDTHDRFRQNYDLSKMRNLIIKARGGRCRTRFPVPVILYEGKNVCRSATVSSLKEVYARKIIDYIGSTLQGAFEQVELNDENSYDDAQPGCSADERLSDTRLLEAFSVSYICDLMVENAKVKYGVSVSSSEKIEKRAYSAFNILCLPYPGCEFFKNYRCHEHSRKDLMFDWTQDYVDSVLILPSDTLVYFSNLGIDFSEYKKWDLITLTQNYVKVLLKHIIEGTSSILIHCISGWDRTPLFISLLRLSLWADGKVHASLSAIEILYLTLAYDWYLFGHKLPQRLRSDEEILYFCFHFIKHLSSEDFSIVRRKEIKMPLDPVLGVLREDFYAGLSSKSSSFSSISQDSLPPVYFSVHSRESSPIDNGNIVIGKEHFTSKHENPSADTNCNTSHSSGQPYRQDYNSSVPVPVPSVRRRADSTSSIGCGSWQIITGAGSVRGSESSKSSVNSPPSEVNQNMHLDKSVIPPVSTCYNGPSLLTREEKLERVRSLFHKVYVAVLGTRYGNPNETSVQSTFYQIAEKVGVVTTKTPE